MKTPPLYITVTDPEGAIQTGTNQLVPVTHRMYYQSNGFYGSESIARLFRSEQLLTQFCIAILKTPTGTHGRLSWEYK